MSQVFGRPNVLDRLRRSGHFRDLARGISGVAAGQIVTVIAVPVVARLFSPSDYGKAAAYVSIVAVVSQIACLGYEQAIVLPKHRTQSTAILALCIMIALISASLFMAIVLLAEITNVSQALEQKLEGVAFWLPVGVFLYCIAYAVLQWNISRGRFGVIASSEAAVAAFTSGSRITWGALFGSSLLALVLTYLAGLLTQLLVLAGRGGWSLFREDIQKIQPNIRTTLTETASAYRDFPVYSAPTALIRAGKESLPVLAFTLLFPASVIGWYAMANRLMVLPISLFILPFRRVFIRMVREKWNDGHAIAGVLKKATALVLVLGIFPYGCVALWGAQLFSIVLGARWEQGGHYAAIMAPWVFSIFVLSPASAALTVIRRQDVWMKSQAIGLAVAIAVMAIADMHRWSSELTLMVFSGTQLIINVLTLGWTIAICGVPRRLANAGSGMEA